MKIILDAMGGDNAPDAVVRGALEAAKEFGVQIVLVGRGADILASMKAQGWDTLPDGVELANAEDVVDMHCDPAAVVKQHPNSSLVLGARMLAQGGGDAFISAGNTGALLTAIIQSSSASVGILQALSVTGSITYANAVPIILGQNIGTTVTALLSSIGTNKNARRTAVIHLCFNVIGALVFLILFYTLKATIGFPFINDSINAAGIAAVHTIFNLTSTLILFPFIKWLEKLAYLIIKEDGPNGKEEKISLLDERLLATPSVAIARAKDVTDHMAVLSRDSLFLAMSLIKDFSSEKAAIIRENEEIVDKYEDKLGTYLVKLSRESLSLDDSHEISNLLHSIGDFERMSDHAVNLAEVAEEIFTKKIMFSSDGMKEIQVISRAVAEILTLTTDAFMKEDLELAKQVEPLEQLIDRLKNKMKNRHIQRVRKNECSIETGFVFSDLLTNYERVADHCSNVAVCLIEVANDSFETHEYLSNVKGSGGNDFAQRYEAYKQKYVI